MSGLADARVLELPGDAAVSYCGRLLAEAGARVVLLEEPGAAPADGARRAFLHAGKRSAFADADLELQLTQCAALVLRPADLESDPWTVALRGTALAFTATARLLGMNDAAVDALDETLGAGILFPLPGADAPSDLGQASVLCALDGWVVPGPSSLPAATLTALIEADGAATLEEWVGARDRDEACRILQQWRTTFVPVLDPREVERVDPSERPAVRAPEPGEHTAAVLDEWLAVPAVVA